MHAKTSQYYTGRVNLRHVVQRRQLRSHHADAHYVSALYKYMREMAIENRDSSVFVSADDKAKVDFGEPGAAISSGVRGKKSIVPTTSTLAALDHDLNSKGSITPSVNLMVDLSHSIDQSFYCRQVDVFLKDSVFSASNSFWIVLELSKALKANGLTPGDKNILYFMIDGGPEHNFTFHSLLEVYRDTKTILDIKIKLFKT